MHTQTHTHSLTYAWSIYWHSFLPSLFSSFLFYEPMWWSKLLKITSPFLLLLLLFLPFFIIFPPLVKLFDFDHSIHLISFIIFLQYLFCFVLVGSLFLFGFRFVYFFYYYSWNACLATVIKYIKIVAYISWSQAWKSYRLSVWHVRNAQWFLPLSL